MPHYKQRLMLIDIILENDCSSCKEIFYRASKEDSRIGVATVYRMINALEEIGAISRKNMYKVECTENCKAQGGCEITLDDNYSLPPVRRELEQSSPGGVCGRCGYLKNQKIAKIKTDQ